MNRAAEDFHNHQETVKISIKLGILCVQIVCWGDKSTQKGHQEGKVLKLFDPYFVERFITDDDSRVFEYDPDTKLLSIFKVIHSKKKSRMN